LLFAFFVVMYSISSVNEDKYRVLSNALVGAFNDRPVPLQIQQDVPLVDTPLYNDILSAANQPNAPQVVIPLRLDQGAVVTADATKARRDLGWTPKHPGLTSMIRDAWTSYAP